MPLAGALMVIGRSWFTAILIFDEKHTISGVDCESQ
jgi:hypothetical protein